MNQLSDYITERIRIDNIKKFEFPINDPIEKMVEYLRNHDFTEIPCTSRKMYFDEMRSLFSMEKHNAYIFDEFDGRPKYKILRFVHYPGRPLSTNDPMFNIFYIPNEGRTEYYLEFNSFWETELIKQDFLKIVNKVFNDE